MNLVRSKVRNASFEDIKQRGWFIHITMPGNSIRSCMHHPLRSACYYAMESIIYDKVYVSIVRQLKGAL